MRRVLAGVLVVLVAAAGGLLLSGALASDGGGGDGASSAGSGGGAGASALGAAPVGGATDFAPDAAAADPGRGAAIVARARRATIDVFRRPGAASAAADADRAGAERAQRAADAPASPSRTLQRRTVEGRRLPVVLLVLQRRGDWLRVELPVRPNHATGWVRARDVRLARNPYEIVIQRSRHRLLVTEHGRTILRAPIAVGRSVSPTPRGGYFVTDLLRPPDPDGFYGPYALGLSAYSNVYTSFAGGDGQVGIHGTNDPSVLGSDVSHGCVRVSNDVVRRLARIVPLGTPVAIRA